MGDKASEPELRTVKVASSAQPIRYCDNSVTNSKYNVINFVPRALFEQFRRLANVYFLLMGCLMLLGTYSNLFETPLTAFTTLFPLSIVLTISMIQEGLADIKRHRSDDETNNRLANVTSYKTGSGVTDEATKWRDITVGSLMKVCNRQPLPADVVILCTSEDENVAYIETSSIDGETNLKLRRGISYLPTDQHMTVEEARAYVEKDNAFIECEPPNMKIDSFTGTFKLPTGTVVPIDNDNVLLRGAVLRNTKWIIGVVVYTGEDTKLQRNSRHAPSKMSRIDLLVNQAIYIIFLLDLILVTISTFLLLDFENSNFANLTYVGYYTPGVTSLGALNPMNNGMIWRTEKTRFLEGWLTFIVLFNNLCPISMYVTLEVMTYIHLVYISEDLDMYHEESDTPAKARSNIVSDLGQIQFIFSDKTGTLTQNLMRFKRCSVAGCVYGAPVLMTEANEVLPFVNISQVNADAVAGNKIDDFLKVLSICHTVVVEAESPISPTDVDNNKPKGGIIYQAESPDEKALVEAAKSFDYELTGRTTQSITININGVAQSWTPLTVNKFDSDRKRMSIIVRDANGQLRLLVKGADTAMLYRGYCDSPEEGSIIVEHLRVFAQEGLRTLVLGYKDLTEADYQAWNDKYKEASAAAKDRAELMSKVADEIEKDLKIVGVTAIEDKLQDGVPDTIADLSAAGIKVCVLTGDKLETAINIGYSCQVLRQGMMLFQLTSGTADDVEVGITKLFKTILDKTGRKDYFQAGAKACARGGSQKRQVLAILQKHYPNVGENAAAADVEAGGNAAAPAQERAAAASSAALPPAQIPILVRFTEAAKETKTKLLSLKKSEAQDSMAFVVEGPALIHILGNPTLETMLFEIMQACTAVIACRVSPKQKARLVRLVKDRVKPEPVTLAIGDGANDVGMIQEAHVGIGVSGNEGQQAVNASDFAIAQFRFLKKLLLVHGRWNYRRVSKTVLYSFYKNLVLVMTLFFYLFYCGFSGTSVYEDNVMAGFNFFLGLPIFFLGLFDKDVEADYAMSHPAIYVTGRKNLELNLFQIVKWVCSALLHGYFIYYLTIWSLPMTGTVYSESNYYSLGLGLYAVLILAMDWKVLIEYKTILRPALIPKDEVPPSGKRTDCSRCGWSLWIWVGSILFFFFATLLYNSLIGFAPAFYSVAVYTYNMSSTWLQIALIPIICVGLDALYMYLCDEILLAWSRDSEEKKPRLSLSRMGTDMMKGAETIDPSTHSTRAGAA